MFLEKKSQNKRASVVETLAQNQKGNNIHPSTVPAVTKTQNDHDGGRRPIAPNYIHQNTKPTSNNGLKPTNLLLEVKKVE